MSAQAPTSVGGGGVLGIDRFPDVYTESVWIAVFTFFIVWLLALFLSPIAEGYASFSKPGETKDHPPRSLRNFARAARDSFLILLATTLANQSGHGIDYRIMALTWTSFAVLALWTLLHTLLPVAVDVLWWLDMLVFLPVVGLQIASFALAFTNAPTTR
ncbi:hypothetical protein BC831DRAFT_491353 [Entophlyctis helioformis]|nr:hypothetical protein BC831DRAFT_491353 [Entophlyctis helioformis]